MSKKDKKIEVTLEDAKVTVQSQNLEGTHLRLGKKIIGELIETDNGFAQVIDGQVSEQFKTLDDAVNDILKKYHLNH